MNAETTQKDLAVFFNVAALETGDADYDATHAFFAHLAVSELDNLILGPNAIERATENAALRMMNVMQALTGKTVSDAQERASDFSARSMRDIKDERDFPDALIETCKEAWDYTLHAMKMDRDTTPSTLYAARPRFNLGFTLGIRS